MHPHLQRMGQDQPSGLPSSPHLLQHQCCLAPVTAEEQFRTSHIHTYRHVHIHTHTTHTHTHTQQAHTTGTLPFIVCGCLDLPVVLFRHLPRPLCSEILMLPQVPHQQPMVLLHLKHPHPQEFLGVILRGGLPTRLQQTAVGTLA